MAVAAVAMIAERPAVTQAVQCQYTRFVGPMADVGLSSDFQIGRTLNSLTIGECANVSCAGRLPTRPDHRFEDLFAPNSDAVMR